MKKSVLLIVLTMVVIFISLFFFYKQPQQRNFVILITIDTLRADHLGCYGYMRNTSPFIDSLAKKGVLFENAVSQSATTCSSHASLFTGLYPSQHRVLANGYELDISHTTLAEILAQNGYATAAFTSTDRHFLRSNLNQGFAHYNEPRDTNQTYQLHYRPAVNTIDEACEWLEGFDARENLFLWVHLFDPHAPYRRPEKQYQELVNTDDREAFDLYLDQIGVNRQIFESEGQSAYDYITTYDAEIAYVDEQLQRLYSLVEAKGMQGEAKWIVTADHGESLGQHNWLGHATQLYQEDIHVPLLFVDGGRQSDTGRRVGDVVENFDIFPTVLDWLGIRLEMDKKREIQAESLFPFLMGQGSIIRQYAFSERQIYTKKPAYPPGTPFWGIHWEDGDKYAIINQHWKYIHKTKAEGELYNLTGDPFELDSRISERDEVSEYAGLFYKMGLILNRFKQYSQKKSKLVDEKTLDKLKSLGYLQ